MRLISQHVAWGLMAIVAIVTLGSARSHADNELQFDLLLLKNGTTLPGLIVEESAAQIRFQYVRRKPGRMTTIFTTSVPRADVLKVVPLTAQQRDTLRQQLELIESGPSLEKELVDQTQLQSIDWDGKPKAGLRYESDFFELRSNAQEALVRRAVVRLEQIYTAYTRYLPPRFPGGKPTTIILLRTVDEYRRYVEPHGGKIDNPAFYDPEENRIVCVSGLTTLADDLEKVRQKHHEIWQRLSADEAELRKLYANDRITLARVLEPITATKKRIASTERYNDTLVDKATERLFAILYHEAFHAYATTFVYPIRQGELPRWLNEGLAQIFETALVEANELRVGHADRQRLFRCRELLHKNELMTIRELLGVGKREFIVGHDGRKESERVYLTSWSLAFYLTFDRRLLGTPALDDYIRAQQGMVEPIAAFEKLVGQPLDKFESDFRQYLMRLQPDGTLLDLKRKP